MESSRLKTAALRGFVIALVFFGLVFSFRNKEHPTAPSPAPTGNPAHDKVMKLDPDARAAALGLAVTATGDICRGKDAFFQGIYPKDNSAFWSVRCTNGKEYQVSIAANATGHTDIMDCGILKAVADVDCFIRLDAQDNRPQRSKKQMKADLERLSPAQKREIMNRLKKNLGKP